ncbi:head protein [Haloarcula hispanica virus PH1]|uniref:Capsid protein VP1 n=1 Tax=Haloarcula hispanica virus PH1 TaxID=1282967 RepID=M4JG74_9VIRU|nr:head protein [Haloarcula hispanica virus PH1]AGC65537.1 capsid protein VP1 [Haloarcula hispanica virus PH1]
MDPQNWSEIPSDKLGELDYGLKHSEDAAVAVGYVHADPGYVTWATEGKLHEGGPEARLDFYADKEDARQAVHDYAADHPDVMNARQAVRGTGDAAKGVADPDGMDENLPWSAFGGGRQVKNAVEDAFSSPEELAEASDAHLASFEGVGPKTIEDLRAWLVEEGYADGPDTDDDGYTEGDIDISVEPSGLELDDPATEITGVGDSSNLARDTVGDFWDMGCPFHEVAGAWQEEALKDILGASFFMNTQPGHIIRLFAGYTAAYGYDRSGEELGNYAEAMFSEFDWDDVRWAWADHGLTTEFGKVAAASEIIEEQAAVATGDELPQWELDFDPEEDTGLSGLHMVEDADVFHDSNTGAAEGVHYTADVDHENDDVYVPFETVALYSLLFQVDYSDPQNAEHVRLVVDTGTSDEAKQLNLTSSGSGRNNRYVAVFDHPNADLHGIAEGQLTVKPRDFDLEEPSEYRAWAEEAARQIEERREAHRREVQRGPDDLRDVAGVSPPDALEDATHTLGEPNVDREDPNELDHFDSVMGDIYDPVPDVAGEVEENVQAAEEAGVLDGDVGDLEDPTHSTNIGGKTYHFPVQIGDFDIVKAQPSLVYENGGSLSVHVEQHQDIADSFKFLLHDEDEGLEAVETGTGRTPKDFFEWFDGLEATGDADPVYPKTEESSIARKEKPEDVAGYEVVTNDPQGGMIEWEGKGGGTPPSGLLQQDYNTELQLMNSGGRYKHRWLLRVHWRAGTDHKVRTIMQWKYAGTDGQDAARKENKEKGIARAEEWMRENPAEGADDGDQPPTERVEAFADRTGVPADVSERIFTDFGTAVGKDWEHTEERIYKAADYGKERDRLLSVKGVGEARQKQIAEADGDDDGTDLETTVAEIENAPPGGWTEEDRVDGGDDQTVYDAYTEKDLDPEKAREQIGRYLMATVPEDVARRLAETFGNTQSLAGATLGQLRDVEGVGDAVVREFYKAVPDDENLTIAHGQKRADWGPFSTFGGYGPRLDRKPETGDYLGFEYADSGGMAGWVTRVEGDEALVRLDANSQPDRYDWEDGVVEDVNGEVHDVQHVEVGDKQAPGDLLDEDAPGGGFEVPEEDDLQDALAAKGINNIVASNLADQYDSMDAVEQAVAGADDPSELHGVGEASAAQVGEAFGQAASDGGSVLPPEMDPAEYDGPYKNQRMEDAHYWAAQLVGWMKNGPNAGLRGSYYVDILAGKPVLVMDDTWLESNVDAIKTEMRNVGFPSPIREKEMDDGGWRLFIREPTNGDRLPTSYYPGDWRDFETTGGDGGDPDAMFAQDQLDTWDTPNPNVEDDDSDPAGDREEAEENRKAVQAARDTDPDDDLPGPALAALKKNWSVYKRGLKEGREAVEEAEEYRDDHRKKAERAAAIINDIRDAYGQEPIDFDGVEGVPAVEELGGPITAESSGVSLSFDWKADPYDPTEEVL